MFKIVADDAIVWLDKLFAAHGDIHRYSTRQLDSSVLKDAELLLIRSTVRIDKHLLKNSSVKLIASATVGCDHVDRNALNKLGIAFAHAPGCNSNSVAEYVISAVAWHAMQGKIRLADGLTAAVIGCGRIGSQVKHKLELLGFNVIVNDPPLAQTGPFNDPPYTFVTLEEALRADVICVHTPLTYTGDFATHHLLNKDSLARIKDHALLINAGRGGVIDNKALARLLDERHELNVVLDVWENEPNIDWELLSRVNLGTPHIAGHSWRGKVNGTVMIYRRACEFFGWEEQILDDQAFCVPLPEYKGSDNVQLYDLVSRCYDIGADTAELRRRAIAKTASEAACEFDSFRKHYYRRPEFSDLKCAVPPSLSNIVRSLGFRVIC